MSTTERTLTSEQADMLQTLRKHRGFLRFTARDLSDEQASTRSTPSQLSIGGIIKHVTLVERQWARFIVEGASATGRWDDPEQIERYMNAFRMLPGETLAGLLSDYDQTAVETDELLVSLADLDVAHPLPEAPWHEKGASWTARRTFLHVIAETAQHAGHADIIREAIDGQKTMG
jgi:uncharacterized damage-inducible protein DinB